MEAVGAAIEIERWINVAAAGGTAIFGDAGGGAKLGAGRSDSLGRGAGASEPAYRAPHGGTQSAVSDEAGEKAAHGAGTGGGLTANASSCRGRRAEYQC